MHERKEVCGCDEKVQPANFFMFIHQKFQACFLAQFQGYET